MGLYWDNAKVNGNYYLMAHTEGKGAQHLFCTPEESVHKEAGRPCNTSEAAGRGCGGRENLSIAKPP